MLFLAGTAEDFTALAGGLRTDDRDPRFSAIASEDGMSRLRYLEGALSETELLSRPRPPKWKGPDGSMSSPGSDWRAATVPGPKPRFVPFTTGCQPRAPGGSPAALTIRMKNDPTWPKWTAEKK